MQGTIEGPTTSGRLLALALAATAATLAFTGVASAATLSVTPSTDLPREGQLVQVSATGDPGVSYELVQVARGPGYAYCNGFGITFTSGFGGSVRASLTLNSGLQRDICRNPAMPPQIDCETDATRTCAFEMRDSATGAVAATAPIVFRAGPPPDTTPPETTLVGPPVRVLTTRFPHFEAKSSELTGSLQCSLDGAPFAACPPGLNYGPFSTGTRHVLLIRALDVLGNADPTPASVTFTIDAEPDPPTLGQTFNVFPGGRVLVRPRGAGKYTRILNSQQFPIGSSVDARRARPTIQTAPPSTKQTGAQLSQGRFTVLQAKTPGAIAEMRLDGPMTGCSHGKNRKGAKGIKGRRLIGTSKDPLTIRGRRGVATTKGTTTLIVQDLCDGRTLLKTTKGSAKVRDLVRRRTVTLKGLKTYIVRPRRK